MATFTADKMSPTVFGNMRVVTGIMTFTGNSASETVGLGMEYIASLQATIKSGATTLAMRFAISGSSAVGALASACTGADFYITAFGK